MKTAFMAVMILAASAVRADPIAPEVTAGVQKPFSSIGVAIGIGGGVTNYTGSQMTDVADVGGTWEARATVGTRLFLAGEVAYVGSRRNINVNGVFGTPGESPHIFSNGLEGDIRAQYPIYTGSWLIEPFAFGGVGWTHVGVDATYGSTAQLSGTSDDILVVPLGGGISAAWNGLVLESRFTYRPAFNEALMVNGTTANLSNWSLGALVGYEF